MTPPTIEPLGPLDSTFVHLEDGINHMHIASCCIFAGPPPTLADIRGLVRDALDQVPRYRQRLRTVPGGLGPPVWVDDGAFRLARHVHHVSLPRTTLLPEDRGELEALMGRLMSVELDRGRPLWDTWLVTGPTTDRWALISKVHHCMVDGIAGTDLLATILAGPTDASRRPRIDVVPEPSDARLVADALVRLARRPRALLRDVGHAATHPQQTTQQVIGFLRGSRSLATRLRPTGRLPTDGPIGPDRVWATSSIALDDVRQVRARHGGTVNDVVLAAVAGAHRALLLGRGADLDGAVMRTLVPVSIRRDGEQRADNQVSAIIAELPIALPTASERLAAVREQMDRLKQAHQVDAVTALLGAAAEVPAVFGPAVHALTAWYQHTERHGVQTVTTNVPGPRQPLSAWGRQLLEYLPFVPIYAGMRVGVAALSYVDRISFGVTGDATTVPDVGVLADAIPAELEALLR